MAQATDIIQSNAGNFAHMNVFFVITTVVVILIGILLAVVLYKTMKILNDVKHVSQNISEESDNVRADVRELRAKTKAQGFKIAALVATAKHSVTRIFKKASKKRHK